jgi:hypothetical protein
MADIVETLFDLANDIDAGERVDGEDVMAAMREGAEEVETLRRDFKAALDLIDDVFTHGDSARWADRAGDFLQQVKNGR